MGHLCRVPYKIGKVKGNREKKEECEETEKLISRTESTVKDANDEHSTDKPKEDDEERMYDPMAISAVRQVVDSAHCIGCERPESPI